MIKGDKWQQWEKCVYTATKFDQWKYKKSLIGCPNKRQTIWAIHFDVLASIIVLFAFIFFQFICPVLFVLLFCYVWVWMPSFTILSFMSPNVQAQPLLKSTILFTKNTQRKQFHFQFQQNGKHHHTFRTLFFVLFLLCYFAKEFEFNNFSSSLQCDAMQSKAKLLFLFGWTKNCVCVWCVSKEEWLFKPK